MKLLSPYSVLPQEENQKESRIRDCACELVHVLTAVNCREVYTTRAHEDTRNYVGIATQFLTFSLIKASDFIKITLLMTTFMS